MNSLLSLLDSPDWLDKVIAGDARQAITGREIVQRCNDLAKKLLAEGISVLALHADNSVNWMVVDLACQQANICLVPLPTFFSQEQLGNVLQTISVDAVLCEQLQAFPYWPECQLKQQPTTLADFTLLIKRQQFQSNKARSELPQGTGKITFTSGSTGNPKGVCLGNTQLIMQAGALAEQVKLTGPRHLCLLPLSTLLENVAGIYASLLAQGTVIIPSLAEIGFDGSSALNTRQFMRAITTHSPNSIIVTPQLLQVLISSVEAGWKLPDSLAFVAVGGARVSPRLLTRAHELNIPAYEGYGLSECVSVVSVNTPGANHRNSCGRPLPHLDIEIENNEIIVTGNIMLGYAGNPESWNQSRIYTGDMGYLDDHGFLYINGRKKNLLISSFGRNINPEWIESELLAQFAISECVVFGEARPFLVALLSVRPDHRLPEEIQQIIDKVNNRLPDYARIKNWYRLKQPLSNHRHLITDNGRPRRQLIASEYAELIDSLYPLEKKTGNL